LLSLPRLLLMSQCVHIVILEKASDSGRVSKLDVELTQCKHELLAAQADLAQAKKVCYRSLSVVRNIRQCTFVAHSFKCLLMNPPS
jgi:predicted nucleic acid-binding Zn finger protein